MLYNAHITEVTTILDQTDNIAISVTKIPLLIELYFPNQTLRSNSIDPLLFDELCKSKNIILPEKFSNFRIFKRQIEWLAGRISFSQLDLKYFGGNHQIDNDSSGAPFICGMSNTISITHAGDFAVAAISLDPSINLGIDIERIRGFDYRQSFLGIAFPEENYDSLELMSDEEILTLWTLKESFLKILRLGFAENLKEVRITPDCFVYKGNTITNLKRKTYKIENHILSVIHGHYPE